MNFSSDTGKVGDDLCWGIMYIRRKRFKFEINLGKTLVDSRQFFDGNLSYFREQDQGSSLDEYFSLSGQYQTYFVR